ncbi:uncharacterized protein LOC135464419 [Liolophura sinensis]|uniref:uncharacterized protein LOC135464419 n=1 Tax=Liolophura sinensis TaxID=3198878 RepID=UPI003158A2E1
MELFGLVFLGILGAVWAQFPTPCTPPTQFRTRISQYDHGRDIIRSFNVTYDETNRRKYIVEEERNVIPGNQFFTYIVLVQEKVLYTIDHKTHVCTKTPNPTWRSIAIAPNSTFEDQLSFGGPGEVIYASQWSDRVPLRKSESLLVEFTAQKCYPLRFVYVTRGDVTATVSEFYRDFQMGIPDTSVFTPPSECRSAKWVPQPKHFLGMSLIWRSTMQIALLLLISAVAILAQDPTPCFTPRQFHGRVAQYNHAQDYERKFIFTYDEPNRRIVVFEEDLVVIPGKKFYEYLILNNENVLYTINIKTRECTRSTPQPWRSWGIPQNATFEDEYTVGGPGEEIFVTEWSDRIPLRRREFWIGSFSNKNCYPIRTVVIANANITDTVTTNYYDIIEGIPNPNDFVPPPECNQAKFVENAYIAFHH